MAYIVLEKCILCDACLSECPSISIRKGKTQVYIDADTCQEHALCTTLCPVDAIVKLEDSHVRLEKADD